MAEFNWTRPTVGILYQNYLGVRAMRLGKSKYFFTVEGVYTAFQKSRRAEIGNEIVGTGKRRTEIWRKPFDPEDPDGFDVSKMLLELQSRARSMSCVTCKHAVFDPRPDPNQ